MTTPMKAKLEALKTELEKRIAGINKDLSKPKSADSEEQVVERENDDVLLALKTEGEAELAQVAAALQRIENGSYGVCAGCGGAIEEARLEAMPFTSLCIACANKAG
ncbi:MAG: TraR/DksA family transcriptional regulator [bacterium]